MKFIYHAVIALISIPSVSTSQDSSLAITAFGKGDYVTALQQWQPLADEGYVVAQVGLAAIYYEGLGVPQDYTVAARWLKLAADQGDANSQDHLGRMYDEGLGVPQDYTEAARWFRMAANQGLARAQTKLAIQYFAGEGLIQDYVSAHMWLNIASANGSDLAPKFRNIIALEMSSEDISEAQRRARLCINSEYQYCD